MKSQKSLLLLFALTLISFIGFTACSSGGGSSTGQLNVNMTDAPADYDEVNVNIESVSVRYEDGTNGEGEEDAWITIMDEPMTVNLLNLRNGNEITLGNQTLETGSYTQMRFVLGDNNTIVVDGQTFDLKTPSGQQSGVKLQIDAEIEEGETYQLLVDFDAGQSVVKTGNDRYILKPVLRAVNVEAAGTIAGTVEPNTFQSYVFAVTGEDTLSTYNESSGAFKISALAPGTYDVTLQPDSDQYQDTTITDVNVLEGDETDLGTITLKESTQ